MTKEIGWSLFLVEPDIRLRPKCLDDNLICFESGNCNQYGRLSRVVRGEGEDSGEVGDCARICPLVAESIRRAKLLESKLHKKGRKGLSTRELKRVQRVVSGLGEGDGDLLKEFEKLGFGKKRGPRGG